MDSVLRALRGGGFRYDTVDVEPGYLTLAVHDWPKGVLIVSVDHMGVVLATETPRKRFGRWGKSVTTEIDLTDLEWWIVEAGHSRRDRVR